MKGAILGAFGVAGVSFAVVNGGGGPDDFIRTINKPPEAVYAAFSDIAPEGVTELPSGDGWESTVKQTITKVQNEELKYELTVDGEVLLMAELQLTPAANGTTIAAELEFDTDMVNELMKEAGAPPMPTFAFQSFLLDQVFAQAMNEMASRIEEGKPLLSIGDSYARWGSGGDSGDESGSGLGNTPYGSSPHSWEQHEASRPQLDVRPETGLD